MKFRIFHPFRGPRVQNLIAWGSMILGISVIILTKSNKDFYDFTFYLSIFLLAGIPIFIMIVGYLTYEPLNGQIKGYLVFERERIIIDNKIIPKSEITRLKIICSSYEGELDIPISEYQFRPARSSGTENYMKISTNNVKNQKVFFQVESKPDFKQLKEYLDSYYFGLYRYGSFIRVD